MKNTLSIISKTGCLALLVGAVLFVHEGILAAELSYVVVDTGQTRTYGNNDEISPPAAGFAFYGQDAQLEKNPPDYTTSGDGLTVLDNNTGLVWTQSPDLNGDGVIDVDDKLAYDEAVSFPDTLNAQNFGGYNDWRLPSIKELYSLILFNGTDPTNFSEITSSLVPFIDTDYFDFGYGDVDAGERVIDAQFASTTLYVASTFNDGGGTMFGVNLADGRIKGYGLNILGREKTFYALFVRGDEGYGVNRFTDNNDGTITDAATGLMWSQNDSGGSMNWEEALAWVQTKNNENYLGHHDWRLPNAKELQSIVDYTRSPDTTSSPAIDPVFNTTSIYNEAGQMDYPWFWTSTTHIRDMVQGSGRGAAYIAFGRAMGYMGGQWADVHGAGAQRSDPKSGDPEDYPVGQGPQGDAIRIYNFVRPVRDAGSTNSSNDTAGEATRITISANGTENAQVQSGGQVTVSISLAPGEIAGQTADWWMLWFHEEYDQWRSYVLGQGWVSGFSPALQGALVSFSAFPVFNGSLEEGTHEFYFGFDLTPNGSPDLGSLAYEQAIVRVSG